MHESIMPDTVSQRKRNLDFYVYNALDSISGRSLYHSPELPILEDIGLDDIIYEFNHLGFDSICINLNWVDANAHIYANGYEDLWSLF